MTKEEYFFITNTMKELPTSFLFLIILILCLPWIYNAAKPKRVGSYTNSHNIDNVAQV